MSKTLSFRKTSRRSLLKPVLVLLCGGVVLAAGVGAWGVMQWRRSLPQMQGEVALSGLAAAVEVYRDSHGVPAIFAQNRADALRALGYLHASERLFSMEMNRRAGQGRLAEAVGTSMVTLDKFLRTLDLYRLAQASYTQFKPEHQALFQAYADGVNAWLQTHGEALPLEFALLGLKPEPWQPADSLVWGKLMALRLGANMASELQRAALLTVQPLEVVERLYPAYPSDAPITTRPDFAALPMPDATPAMPATPPPSIPSETIPPDPKSPQRSDLSPAVRQAALLLAQTIPFAVPGASNEWVVRGERSISGKPILANDPHLGLETPGLWYLARLVTPEGELKGATVPGLPVVLLGQNSQIAWGFTTTNSDVQDVFAETLDPQDSTRYLTPEGSAPFITREEIIKVKDGAEIKLTVRSTRHGPVISDIDEAAQRALRDSKQVLALAFSGLQADDRTAESLLLINAAQDWNSFQKALQLYQTPPQNIVYADRSGNIGFTNPGLVPVRKAGDGRYPADGATGTYDWRGMVPFTEIPRLYNPAGGTIVNGNNAVVGAGGLYSYGRDWDTPYRAERITTLLRPERPMTLDDHAAVQADLLSLPAQRILPFLLQTKASSPQAEQVVQLLRGWDYNLQADRPEPLIAEWWILRLYDQLVRPPFGALGKTLSPNQRVLETLLHEPQGWCDTLLAEKSADCAPQIAAALAQTLAELTARYGADITRWRYGDEHFAPLENKVLGKVPGFNARFGLQHGSDGGFYTVNRGGNFDESGAQHPLIKTHGSGYRALYDLADPAQSRFMIATGQSGHPLSSHYGDLTPLWRDNRSITLTGDKATFTQQGAPLLRFVP